MENGQQAMTDWSLIIASIALVLSVAANYTNFRSATIHLIGDFRRFKHAVLVRKVQLMVKRYGRDHDRAAAYLNSQPKALAAEVLTRICGGSPGVAKLHGPINRIIFSMLDEHTTELAGFVHEYYRAQEAHDKREMDRARDMIGFALGSFIWRYHPVLQVSCAMKAHMPTRVGGVIAAIGLEHVGANCARVGWDVRVDEDIPAKLLMHGVVELKKLETGFWRVTDFRLRA